jgi:hypothetical protein
MRRSSRPLATITVAIGPEAAIRTIATFEALRYFVVKAAADFVMKPHDRDMLAALVDG